MDKPLVSISCITYNHGLYIKECLDGFLKQKTDFPFEILINDDASSDDTVKIIKEYEAKYPDIIKPIYQLENQYSKGQRGISIKYNFQRAKGKYIAMCEGDDYWTEPLKLQKQVDFLENNKGYILSFHDAVESENNEIIYNNNRNDLCEEDLILNSHLHTSTILFRWNENIREKTKDISVVNGDTALYSVLGHFGKGKYIHNISPSVYRIHEGGVWSGKKIEYKLKSAIETYYWILQHSNIKYHKALREKILKKSVSLAVVQRASKKWRSLFKNFNNIIVLSIKTGKFRYFLYLLKKIIGI